MVNTELVALGQRLAELRITRQLKQAELAYEAGVSHRTLQRLEAGEAVNSAGLIKVIKCLGRLEGVLTALASAGFSPYEKLADAGLKVSQLKQQRDTAILTGAGQAASGVAKPAARKRRVRRPRDEEAGNGKFSGRAGKVVTVQWPEDQS